ncbi:hypothetical protein JF775_21655, partial [Mycobacterium sp. WUMAC-025]|nr:hypothetical protein [Mycobacterium sp. WUMAC-025]
STSARARRAAAARAAEAEAVALPEEEETKKRRQRVRATQLGRGYEYMDLEPATTASDRPAPAMGFAGTIPTKAATAPAGLSALVVDEFDDGPRTPMVPGTWDADPTGSKP